MHNCCYALPTHWYYSSLFFIFHERSWAAILCTIYSSSHFQEFSLSFSCNDKLFFVSLIIWWEIYHKNIINSLITALPSVGIGHEIYSFSFRDAKSDTDSWHRWIFQYCNIVAVLCRIGWDENFNFLKCFLSNKINFKCPPLVNFFHL